MATFDNDSAKRIANAVRDIERMGGSMGSPGGEQRSPMKSPAAVMIIGARNSGNGFFPGKYVYFNNAFQTCNATTTSTTSTTSSTTTTTTSTTAPPTTTTFQNIPFLNFSNLSTPDCWVMVKATDVSTVEIGDVFDGHTVNTLAEDGLPVFLVSYSLAGTCPGTTTTTDNPCAGRCKWNWSAVSNAWTLSDSTCASGCGCPYPDACNDAGCGVALTSCYSGLVFPPPAPCGCVTTTTGTSTTSTTPGPGTTTTTRGPDCRGCFWKWLETSGWILSVKACSGTACSNTCATPTGGGTNCATTITPCGGTTTTTPAPACTGQCNYFSDGLNWILISNQCRNGCSYGSCDCRPPSFAPTACADRASTPCLCPSDPNTTTTAPGSTTTTLGPCTTTTRGPDCFSGRCRWAWDAGTSTWFLRSSNCALSCLCDYPGGIGSFDCQIKEGPCNGSTTTSTTTTSTTTTTTAAPCSSAICTQRVLSCSTGTGFGASNEITLGATCETGAPCSNVPFGGNCGCASFGKRNIGVAPCSAYPVGFCFTYGTGVCGPTTTTVSPTTTTTSTTTACPSCVGYCRFRCTYGTCAGGVIGNCWKVASSECVTACGCRCDPAWTNSPCTAVGGYMFDPCQQGPTTTAAPTTTTITTLPTTGGGS